ncbi:hypothetical protein ACVWW1_005750 [Bradyrhizobium sp. JR3.5]
MAEHRPLGQAGGAAGILQQRDVLDVDRRPLRRLDCTVDELAVRDNSWIVRQRGLRRADLAPMIILANDQAVEQPLGEEFQRRRQQRRQVAGDQHPRA